MNRLTERLDYLYRYVHWAIYWRLELVYKRYDARRRDRVANRLPPEQRTFQCAVCESLVSDWVPLPAVYDRLQKRYGNPYRLEDCETLNVRHYSCPVCLASDRDRLYALLFAERLGNEPVDFLEFAPTPAMADFYKRIMGLNRRTADLYMKGVDDRVDITDMQLYPADRFDVVLCSHVLEHVPDDRRAMREIHRILKPGGWAVVMVPINLKALEIDEDPNVTDVKERWRRFGQSDHIRHYSKAGFVHRLREAGFAVTELGISHFGEAAFARAAITPTSVVYVASKSCQTGAKDG